MQRGGKRREKREGVEVEDDTEGAGKAVLWVWVSGWVEHLERIREERGGDGQSRVQQEEEEMRAEKKKSATRFEEGKWACFLSEAQRL